MKTFSATHLNKHAQEVFAAAKEDGNTVINHDRYPNGNFVISYISVDEMYADADPAIAAPPPHPASDQQ